MRTTAATRPPEPKAADLGQANEFQSTVVQRNYPVLPSMPYLQAMAKVMELCEYDETLARASLDIARRIGFDAEPAPKGLINITYIAGAFTIENRQS